MRAGVPLSPREDYYVRDVIDKAVQHSYTFRMLRSPPGSPRDTLFARWCRSIGA
jgi:hypothetical protein